MHTPHLTLWPRPQAGDCGDFYFRYIDQLPSVDILTYLHTQRDWFGEWIASLTPEQARYRYAPGKWSLAQMIGHVLDTERIFAYRMLAISRGEAVGLPGFDEDTYAANTIYDAISPEHLAQEWNAVRSSTILLARHMDETMRSRTGIANNLPLKAAAVPFVMAGHVLHHYTVGRTRYLHEDQA